MNHERQSLQAKKVKDDKFGMLIIKLTLILGNAELDLPAGLTLF